MELSDNERMTAILAVLLAGFAAFWSTGVALAAEVRPSGSGQLSARDPIPATGAPPARAVPASRGIALNFDHVDIATVIQAVSEIAGFNYVLAPDVRGTVTINTSAPLRPDELFPVFLAILEINGFTAVRAGTLWKIVRIETARERAIPTIIQQ